MRLVEYLDTFNPHPLVLVRQLVLPQVCERHTEVFAVVAFVDRCDAAEVCSAASLLEGDAYCRGGLHDAPPSRYRTDLACSSLGTKLK